MPDYGVRIGNEVYDSVSGSSQIRALHDQIIIEPLEWRPSKIIDTVYWGKPLWGIVRAIGPGCYPIVYLDENADRLPDWKRLKRKYAVRSKHFKPTTVKVGEKVELGGLEIGGYLHTAFRWGDKMCVMCREEDIAAVHE